MTHVAVAIPAENDLLCEGCGYTLNGLPDDSNCPECGKPIAESTGVGRREPPAWEAIDSSRVRAFFTTTAAVLFRPTHFYRTLATRRDTRRALVFARVHWIVAAALFGTAATVHTEWFLNIGGYTIRPHRYVIPFVIIAALTYVALAGTTALAARLTHWEASYRGLRMPLAVVKRGLYYHAAHYLPVGLVAAITVVAFVWLLSRGALGVTWYTRYLYILSAEVILGALYLFKTYWIGMRNMMFANR
ncbi:MAG: hypothetical protein WBD40_12580 [Tepidisphaeraceae bacterium]